MRLIIRICAIANRMASRARAQSLADSLADVTRRVNTVATPSQPVRLVAVSKLKPASDILAIYDAARQRHMGENYVQELLEKAETLPRDIQWHFIGQLQTNKCKILAERIPNLWAVESVDSVKKADALEKGRAGLILRAPESPKLRVFVQINTSGEESKSGCLPSEGVVLARHIITACHHLKLQGLMTIGAIARSKASETPNEDFIVLRETRDNIANELGIALELSMGMSADFEHAIKMGATNIRVGSTIFGERPQKDPKAKEEVVLVNSTLT